MLNNKFPKIFFNSFLIILGTLFLTLFIKNTIIFAILALLLIYFVSAKLKIKRFAILLFVFSLITRLIAIFILKTPIELDFDVLYKASLQLLEGDLSYNQLPYFKLWGYQIGQVVYQTLLLNIWNNVLIIKIINCLISSGTVVLVYLIGKQLFKEKTARTIGILYSIFLFPLLFNSVLSNQILSTFLFYFAVYIMFSKRNEDKKWWLKYLLSGILMGLAEIIRPEGIVFVTTIIVWLIYFLKKGNVLNTIKKTGLIFISYFAVTTVASLILISTNISPSGLSNHDPLWKFVLGFNHETVGMYSSDDEYIVGNKELELELIKDRTIGSIEKVPILFIKKARNFWFVSDISWSNGYLEGETLNILGINISGSQINEILNSFNKNIYYFMYFSLFLGLYVSRKNKKNELSNFLIILLCVYVGVYLLIEIMPRYAYCPQVALFILSGYGIEHIFKLLEDVKNEKENINSRTLL